MVETAKKFITAIQVAEILGVHPVTASHMIKGGKIPYYQTGRRKKFLAADIHKYLEGCRHNAKNQSTTDPFSTR